MVITVVCLGVSLALSAPQNSQSASSSASQPPTAPNTTVPRLIKFSGVLKSADNHPQAGAVNVNLALYELQQGGSPLWSETQTVNLDEQGRYTVLLGATQAQGLPIDLFTSGKALWLAVDTAAGAPQPRVLLVAVPYALKAADADTLGGKPASAYALAGPTAVAPVVAPASGTVSTVRSGGSSAPAGAASSPLPLAPCTVTSDGNATPTRIAVFTTPCNIENSEITDTGTKIGIGTAAPTYDFDLSKSQNQDTVFRVRNPNTGSAARADLRLEADSAIFSIIAQSVANGNALLFQAQNDNNLAFQQISNSPISFFTNNFERMRILGNGNVGIGTNAPNALLEVNGPAQFDQPVTFVANDSFVGNQTITGDLGIGTGATSLGTYLQIGSSAANPAAALVFGKSQTASQVNLPVIQQTSLDGQENDLTLGARSTSGSIVFFTGLDNGGPNTPMLGTGSNALRMIVTSTGNVGIGTTTPAGGLDVVTGATQLFLGKTGNAGLIRFRRPADGGANGYVGYGWTSQTTNGPLAIVDANGGGEVRIDAYANSGIITAYTSNLERLRVTSQGNVGIGTTAPTNILTVVQGGGHAIADGWNIYSSRRWKTDIHTIHGALGKVEELRGVQYTYTANGHHDIGMIAEEVGKVVPEVVSYEANGKDAQGIDYTRLTALLVQAVKEQESQIKQQQAKIQRLESEVQALKHKS
jgi:hypothetical protein